MRSRTIPLAAVLAWVFVAVHVAGQDSLEKFITIRQGRAPIILSAPHGGLIKIPGVTERKGEGIKKFVTVRDGQVDEIAFKTAALLEKRWGVPVFVVVAHFERKCLDVNRPRDGAYESEKAQPYYDAYHDALRDACRKVQQQWGNGLLLDIHGQGGDAEAIFRGTNGGNAIQKMVAKFGRESVEGPHSVLGYLEKKGIKVLPARNQDQKEDPRYGGGYIVQTYGSHREIGVDAIQLEYGGQFRTKKNLDRTAQDLAEAVEEFAREYLKWPKK